MQLKSMRLLVSNDDGVHAPGIQALAQALMVLGEVTVVAPDRDRSGASNSLTLVNPIRVQNIRPQQYAVTGTPTDCVHLALGGLLEQLPDIVVSGINNSANMGDDTLYSGTVAAAMEGRNLGLPAIAMSLCSVDHRGQYFHTAAAVAVQIVRLLMQQKLPSDTLLNVNVPDLPMAEIKGFMVTRLGNRHRSQPSIPQTDPRGNRVYWIGAAGAVADDAPGTDFDAVRRGYVSITPITMDLTRHGAIADLSQWSTQLQLPIS
jgi:5'-nucleotidase